VENSLEPLPRIRRIRDLGGDECLLDLLFSWSVPDAGQPIRGPAGERSVRRCGASSVDPMNDERARADEEERGQRESREARPSADAISRQRAEERRHRRVSVLPSGLKPAEERTMDPPRRIAGPRPSAHPPLEHGGPSRRERVTLERRLAIE